MPVGAPFCTRPRFKGPPEPQTHLMGTARGSGGPELGSGWWSLASCSWFWPRPWNMQLSPATVPFWMAHSEWRRYSSQARRACRLHSSSAALILRTATGETLSALTCSPGCALHKPGQGTVQEPGDSATWDPQRLGAPDRTCFGGSLGNCHSTLSRLQHRLLSGLPPCF